MDFEDAEDMALALMEDWGLGQWTFGFDRAKRRCGQCHHGKRVISLSRYFVASNGEAEVRDTVLHEIAHGLAGGAAGHGSYWKHWARVVGARPERCAPADVVMPEGGVEGVCGPGCPQRHTRHRLPPKRIRSAYSCNACRMPITWVVLR